jgi:mono/diheme cytochrome c family protein
MRIRWHHTRVIAPVLGLTLAATAWGQGTSMHHMGADHAASAAAPAPIRTTMEALHAQGGVPKGWKFLMPLGDAGKGRDVFISMECFACHAVRGEDFPKSSKRDQGPGPDLTGMGSHHPAEYFAESIVNPNRVIIQGAGYTGSDGLSKMPAYGDTMTVQQLVDVVAYLKSLKGDMGGMAHGAGSKPMEMKGGSSTDKPMEMKGSKMK